MHAYTMQLYIFYRYHCHTMHYYYHHTTDPNVPSSKGNEFVLGFMGNSRVAPVDSARVALFVTTDDPDPVEFTVEYFGRTDTFEARRGRTTLTDLPVSDKHGRRHQN